MRWILIILAAFVLSSNFVFAQSDIRISQIQITGGKNNAANDFIELFDPGSSPVNLKGCRLVKRPGNANSDTLIKSWSKDAFIAAKSFYLWANSGYTAIAAKPDVVSSATIAGDSGAALRFGADNIGTILDSVSWGVTDNGFKNISAQSPQANEALVRQDLSRQSSGFIIAASSPHNSTMTDLAAAFSQSSRKNIPQTASPPSKPTIQNKAPSAAQPKPEISAAEVFASSVLPNVAVAPVSPSATQGGPASPSQGGSVLSSASQGGTTAPSSQLLFKPRSSGVKYLLLAVGALLALVLLLVAKFRKK